MRAILACTLLVAATAAPIDTVRALDKKFAALYNAGNIDAVAALYGEGAQLIPPTGDGFLHGAALKDFFAGAFAHGLKDLSLTPLNVFAEGDGSLMHEIGNVTHSLEPNGGLYYVRWEQNAATGAWQVALDIMAISNPWPPAANAAAAAVKADSNVTKLIRGLDLKFSAMYNHGQFADVADLYNPAAQLVPMTTPAGLGDQFLTGRKAFEGFFADAAKEGIANLTLAPTITLQEGANLIHEIGEVNSAIGGGKYYVRWIGDGAGGWQIAVDIMSIGG